MDLSTTELVRVAVGLLIMIYVGYCIVNQKVWVRGSIGFFSETFAWGSREENQFVFLLHVIAGTVFGLWLSLGPFLL